MLKSFMNLFMMTYPITLNLIMILIMMIPSKSNKSHPLILMMILISLTMIISIKMNFIMNTWMSFILFLTMIGGLMVIFMYITSLTNNELLNQDLKSIFTNLIKMCPLYMLLIYLLFYNFTPIKINLQDSWMIIDLTNHTNINIINIYKEINNNSIYFLMLYIYYTMICIMNICYKLKAPLRKLMF